MRKTVPAAALAILLLVSPLAQGQEPAASVAPPPDLEVGDMVRVAGLASGSARGVAGQLSLRALALDSQRFADDGARLGEKRVERTLGPGVQEPSDGQQNTPSGSRSWPARHPVLTGALIGAGVGAAISSGENDWPGQPAGAALGAGVFAGIGALIGLAFR